MAAATSSERVGGSVENLTEISEIQTALVKLSKEEQSVTDEIDMLLDHHGHLEAKMNSLHRMGPNLQHVSLDAKKLSGMIGCTSELAENVSSKVRQLDLAKSRVQSAIQRVNDILDLKFCTDGVQTALQSEDYEKAAGHIHRYLTLDEKVLKQALPDAREGSSIDASLKVLHEGEQNLKALVRKKLDQAISSSDRPSVERFFKIFPLLNLHEEGLTKFSTYLQAQIVSNAREHLEIASSVDSSDRRAGVLYADALTNLFEDVGKIIEVHQPLVETYYGPGKLLTLIESLQKECDKQAQKIINKFVEQREFSRKSQQVQQSFNRTTYKSSNVHDKLDPRDLDVLLAECTLLNARTELYLRFIRRRVTSDIEVCDEDGPVKEERLSCLERMLRDCTLSRRMQEIIGSYIVMEEYFMRETVMKAVNMDIIEPGTHTSSMVDDIFFILKKCTRRAVSSGSVDCACAMLNHTSTLLESDYRDVLYGKLRAGFPSGSFDVGQAYSMLQQGRLPTSASDTNAAKLEFLTTLNNVEVSIEYTQTLKKSLVEECASLVNQNGGMSKDKLDMCLNELTTHTHKFKDVLEYGLSQLNTSAIKPRIKPMVDVFLSTSHNISEEEFSNYEANDPFVQDFIMNLEQLLNEFKDLLTSSNYDALVSLLTNEVTVQLEKAVLKSVFNRLGGLQFDKELRSLVGYLTSVTQWTIRDKFARLTQMATILNLDRVTEILDYWGSNSGPLTWRLTPAEVRQVLSLRLDFRSEDIKRLKL
ncbi:conserved oligomeric Golgi complex subunit 4-like [Lytechinus variegatus]|uniref:conserved oligomeric Golgi complex subunit 4-like n=1 Tax=Lytechinus variegatus TaxID=7654 RepID=UPI001BB2068D|nr:conserved oligomeric Golgi complex subunit 4-like [Lytechinus variegatus]